MNNHDTSRKPVLPIPPNRARITIGFLLDYPIGHPGYYYDVLLSGVMDECRVRGANLICFHGSKIGTTNGFDAQRNIMYDLATPQTLDGVIACGTVSAWMDIDTGAAYWQRYRPLPIVCVGQKFAGIPGIKSDDMQGVSEAVTHLIREHGCRRIAFVCGSASRDEKKEQRYAAYAATVQQFGIALDPNLVFSGNWTRPGGRAAARELLDDRQLRIGVDVDAIMTANDETAFGLIDELQARGFDVPADVAVIGFDDAAPAVFKIPALTTIRQPIRAQGQRAVESIFAQLRGQTVPELEDLPVTLVIRRSCGCMTAAVKHAASGPIRVKTGESANPMPAYTEIAQAMRPILEAEAVTVDSGLIDKVLVGFCDDLTSAAHTRFLPALDSVLQRVFLAGGDIAAWQDVLSAMQHVMRPHLGTIDILARADILWNQARVIIAETKERAEAQHRLDVGQETQELDLVSQELITEFDMQALLDVLTRGLQRLDIPGCYLALYDDASNPLEQARLVLAYHDHTRLTLTSQQKKFPAPRLLPDGILPPERRTDLLVTPLYFSDQQIGMLIFEFQLPESPVYEILRTQVSSALQGALLVQRVQDNAHELAAAYEEIRILNDQLKEENLRMSAELDVARRLQQMILPKPQELQAIPSLDIVGYMQPADEVGGDYYDVLNANGILHLAIGDVTGHGLESGVLMLMTQTAIRTLIEHGETDPVKFVNTLNQVIYKNIKRMGADKTLTFALVTHQHGQLKLVGQHEELLVVRRDGTVERVDTLRLGFPIGLEADIARWVATATIELAPGDGIVLYTDGIPEAANPRNELYGVERLCQVISRNWQAPAEQIKHAVIQDVFAHIDTQTVYDDLTLVVLKQ